MAMPPDGQSSWHHSSDTLQMSHPDGSKWGDLQVPFDKRSLSLLFPRTDDPWTSSHALQIAVESGRRVVSTSYHPLATSGHGPVAWTVHTPAHELVPHAEFRARKGFEGHVPDAPLIATMSASPGLVTVRDGAGLVRVYVRLVSAPIPLVPGPGLRGALLADGRPLVEYFLPTGNGRQAHTVATSMP